MKVFRSIGAWLYELNEIAVDLLARVLSALALVAVGVLGAWYVREVHASRNASGSMIAANGPYVGNTVISSALLNSRLADVENELTSSLDRNGRGGMLAAMRGTDGTVAAPAFSFTSETGSGPYRIGAGDLGWAILGSKKLELTASLFTVTPNLGVGIAATDILHVSTTSTGLAGGIVENLSGGASAYTTLKLRNDLGDSRYAGLVRTSSGNTAYGGAGSLNLFTVGADNIGFVQNNTLRGQFTSGGLVIGSGGTAISGSFRGTATWNPGALAACGAGPCVTVTTNVTVTGAATGADCVAGVVSPAPLSGYPVQCIITATNTCGLMIVNPSNTIITFGSATFYCRAFNP